MFRFLIFLTLISTSFIQLKAQNMSDGQRIAVNPSSSVYLILDREKRLLNNDIVYNNLFIDKRGVQYIGTLNMELLPTGKPVKNAMLCKGSTAAVYLVLEKTKQHISNPEVFNLFYFDWGKIKTVTDQEILKYKTKKPI